MGCGCKKEVKGKVGDKTKLTPNKLESVRQKIIKLKEQGKQNKKG